MGCAKYRLLFGELLAAGGCLERPWPGAGVRVPQWARGKICYKISAPHLLMTIYQMTPLQSRQNSRLSLQSSEFRIGSPRLLTRKRVLSPPSPHSLVPGGMHSRFRERGRGEPIRTKGQTLWYSMYTVVKSLYGHHFLQDPSRSTVPLKY